jgi:hypothetical protein
MVIANDWYDRSDVVKMVAVRMRARIGPALTGQLGDVAAATTAGSSINQ